ncbi:hypothetical protein [Streptomyces sp. NPDC058326]|uniref:hypothetical protein n=1 Tax=Streptomyces sp. NPDC058326 TaxID=3346447 RepID=UPI0036F08B8E
MLIFDSCIGGTHRSPSLFTNAVTRACVTSYRLQPRPSSTKRSPLEEYELTREDHRRQKQSEEIGASVRLQVDEDIAKCQADPARAERRRQAFENVAKLIQSFKQTDHEIMRWRVRLWAPYLHHRKSAARADIQSSTQMTILRPAHSSELFRIASR